MSAFAIGDRVQILAAGLQDRQGRITSEIGTGPDLRWQVHVDAAPFVADFLALIPEAELALIPPAPVAQDPSAVTLRAEPEAAETAEPEPDDPDTIDAIHGEGFAEQEQLHERKFDRTVSEIDRDPLDGHPNWRLIEGALWLLHRRLQEAERTIASERQQRAIGETAQHRLAEQVHAFGLDQPPGGPSTAPGLQTQLDTLQASWDRQHAELVAANERADANMAAVRHLGNLFNTVIAQREALVDAIKLGEPFDYNEVIRVAEPWGADRAGSAESFLLWLASQGIKP